MNQDTEVLAQQAYPACQGMNCGATDGKSHSAECVTEHHATAVLSGLLQAEQPGEGSGDACRREGWNDAIRAAIENLARHAALAQQPQGEAQPSTADWLSGKSVIPQFTPPAATGAQGLTAASISMSRHSRAMLLNVLWHHQGGSSPVGQPIRVLLGIGQHDRLNDEHLAEAKWIDGLLAAPSASAQQAAAICEACNGSGEGYAGSVCGHCLGRGEPDYKVRFETMVSMIGEISDALGIPDDEAACANGNDLILSAISQLRAPSAISHQEKLARFYPDFAVGIMRESTRGAWVRYVAAPSASAQQAEPVAEVLSSRSGNDTSTIDRALPAGTKLFAAPAPASPAALTREAAERALVNMGLDRADLSGDVWDRIVSAVHGCVINAWKGGQVLERALAASPAALTDYSYQQLFDAISAATKVTSGTEHISISVDAFRAALLAASPADQGEDARDA